MKLTEYKENKNSRTLKQSTLALIFYLAGAAILLFLVLRLPFNDLIEVFNVIGLEIMWLILLPVVCAIPYAMTLIILLDYRISFFDAFYTQISGDGFNGITPLLGMGGEPYKAKHLSRFVSLEQSSVAIVQSRLIHALSGVMFTVIVLLACLMTIDFSTHPAIKLGILAITVIMILAAAGLVWITMSKAPTLFTSFILTKFKLIGELRHAHLTWSKLFLATFCKLVGRGGNFFELFLIFLFLDIAPKFADVILVQGMILASVSVFFFVPQGLGVNEVGIVAALNIAGYSTATGVVFGLIRRARMIIYSLLGLLTYCVGTILYTHKK